MWYTSNVIYFMFSQVLWKFDVLTSLKHAFPLVLCEDYNMVEKKKKKKILWTSFYNAYP